MIGIVACRASSSTVAWAKVRTARASTYWLMTRAKSATLSRTPRPTSSPRRKIGVAAQPGDRRLEADAGPQRRLLEDQAERPARQSSGGRSPRRSSRLSCDRPGRSASRASSAREVEQVDEMAEHRLDHLDLQAAGLPQRRRPGWRTPRRSVRRVMVRAGRRRITCPWVALISSRRSRHSATTSAASTVRSRPIITPRMRISRIRPGSSPRSASKLGAEPLADGACRARAGRLPRSSRSSPAPARQAIGLPPKVRGVHPRLEHLGDLGLGDHHARRDAAGEGLGAGQDVGLDAVVLVGEPLAGAAHAGLDLVEDQQHAALVAQLAQPGEVIRRRDVDAALALDRLDQDRGRLVVERPRRRRRGRRTGRTRSPGPSARSRRGTWAGPWR